MILTRLGRVLLIIIILEVSLGGGGKLFDFGSISPRMVLFGLGLVYTVAELFNRKKIPLEFVCLTAMFVALSGVSALISVLENQSVLAALSDFKPFAYFLMLPFFAITIRKVDDVLLVGRLVKFSALALAVLYLIVLAIWKSGGITTEQMYEWLNPAHTAQAEFLFRGSSTFFFKALLYVGVGVFFFVAEKKMSRKSAVLLLLLAIALTMTRGMWLSVFVILSAWAFFILRDRLKGTAVAAVLLLVGIMGVTWINETLPSVAHSNTIRINDLKALADTADTVDMREVLFGRGFGASVCGREAIEITYVNVIYKQGMVGIFFWLLPAIYLVWRMRDIRNAERRSLAMPYLMATAFVYMVSLTNPFLTNPIGMSVVLVAMVAVRVIGLSSNRKPLWNPGPARLHG